MYRLGSVFVSSRAKSLYESAAGLKWQAQKIASGNGLIRPVQFSGTAISSLSGSTMNVTKTFWQTKVQGRASFPPPPPRARSLTLRHNILRTFRDGGYLFWELQGEWIKRTPLTGPHSYGNGEHFSLRSLTVTKANLIIVYFQFFSQVWWNWMHIDPKIQLMLLKFRNLVPPIVLRDNALAHRQPKPGKRVQLYV